MTAPIGGSHTAEVRIAWSEVPAERRQQKRVLFLLGCLLLVLAYAGRTEWGWGWTVCGSLLFAGGHLVAGDYRRLLVSYLIAGLKDAAEIAAQLAVTARAVWKAILSITGKNGNGGDPPPAAHS